MIPKIDTGYRKLNVPSFPQQMSIILFYSRIESLVLKNKTTKTKVDPCKLLLHKMHEYFGEN